MYHLVKTQATNIKITFKILLHQKVNVKSNKYLPH